jgi:speckle-type POZ protein
VFTEKAAVWGCTNFMKSDLEAKGYLKDDYLEIECDLAVIKVEEVGVPPSDVHRDFGKLLESREGANVTFRVKEVIFQAHRIVLAMRSPVFKAELYGPLRDKLNRIIAVQDMEPPVFKGLLHFIYTDSLPAMDDLDGTEYEEMAKHLLVAADRYGIERMKLMCESILCRRLSVDRVAATLVLADQYHCSKLQDACTRFIDSSNRMEEVAASQGYEQLKRACPVVTAELWQKSAKARKL